MPQTDLQQFRRIFVITRQITQHAERLPSQGRRFAFRRKHGVYIDRVRPVGELRYNLARIAFNDGYTSTNDRLQRGMLPRAHHPICQQCGHDGATLHSGNLVAHCGQQKGVLTETRGSIDDTPHTRAQCPPQRLSAGNLRARILPCNPRGIHI